VRSTAGLHGRPCSGAEPSDPQSFAELGGVFALYHTQEPLRAVAFPTSVPKEGLLGW